MAFFRLEPGVLDSRSCNQDNTGKHDDDGDNDVK